MKNLKSWWDSTKPALLNALAFAVLAISIFFAFCCAIVCLVPLTALAVLLLLHSTFVTITWYSRTKKSKRRIYRKWLREHLRDNLKKFRGTQPVILHISGPSGFDWQSCQYLKPGQVPIYEDYRAVLVGSDEWHGYVRSLMRTDRHKFTREEIVPAIGELRMFMALRDL